MTTNKTVVDFMRGEIKEALSRLPERSHSIFNRMYSPDDIGKDINSVVDDMDVDKLDWALTQVQRSVSIKEKKAHENT